MRFFARLARDLVRWARRRRTSGAHPPAEAHPEERVTPAGAPCSSEAAGVPPPLAATRTRSPLVGEAVPCVVGKPFVDWLLTRSDHQTLTLADRVATPLAAASTISFPPQASQACNGVETSDHRIHAGWALAETAPTTPPAVWTVSVVLVATDRPEGLRRPVGSVLGQSYSGWELLVVETGEAPPPRSTPPDPRIRVVHAPGTTVASGRQRGLEAATGEVIAHLDERSLMAPHWLAEVVASLVAAPADVVIGATVVGDEDRAGCGFPGGLAHHRHVPLTVIDRLLTPGTTEVSGLAPRISVRRLGVPVPVLPLDPGGLSLPTSEPHQVIDLTSAPAAPLALAGL